MLENVIEAMIDAVLVVDGEGRITLSNSATCRLTGYSREQLVNVPIARLLVDEQSGLRTVVRRRIEGGSELRREESWLVTKDGQRIPVSVSGSPVLAEDGSLRGIVIVAHDIRELRRLLADREAEIVRRREVEDELRTAKASIEDRLEQTRSQLLLAERRATLGTLAAGVGHELKNIAQIQMSTIDEITAALESHGLQELMPQVLGDLERVSTHISEHGRRLLQLAKPGPEHVEKFDLNTAVRDVLDMLRGAGRLRRIDTTIAVGREPIFVTVNRTRIEQILVNLVVNAVDAIGEDRPRHGKIEIRVTPTEDQKRVIVEVCDNGSGISPENLTRVFEPFFTTKPDDKGTGLGLPVAREIVQSYGGDLVVASELGKGTTFTFDLPR